jgi:hypothetical protein
MNLSTRVLSLSLTCACAITCVVHAQQAPSETRPLARSFSPSPDLPVLSETTGQIKTTPSKASEVQPTPSPTPLRGRLFMSDAERIARERERRTGKLALVPAPVTAPIASEPSEGEQPETTAKVRTPRRAVTNGFVKRDDGQVLVWVNGRAQPLRKGMQIDSANVGERSTVRLIPTATATSTTTPSTQTIAPKATR